MKRLFVFLFTFLLLVSNTTSLSSKTIWHEDVEIDESFKWYAEEAELRDLQNEERYDYGVGGDNVPGGDTELQISEAPRDFAFNNFTSFYYVIVEGDMGVLSTNTQLYIGGGESQEFFFLMLPISINGTPFFELLFSNITILELVTDSNHSNSYISDGMATYEGQYHETHELKYTWNTETGLLEEKLVTSSTGKQLRVVHENLKSLQQATNPFFLISPIIGIITVVVVKRVKN